MIFLLNSETKIVLPKNASKPIKNAAKILKRDIKKVLSENAESEKNKITVKLSEKSEMLPETFEISFKENSSGMSLDIIGADEFGCIYGLLYISRKYLGVTPFWFWNEQKFERKPFIKIEAKTYRSKPYYVKYRGFFVNDEVLLLGWHSSRYSKKTWQPVFETMLRCGCNMVIPGTGIVNKYTFTMAAEMGLIITHHHAEPLGAKMFLEAYPNEDPSFDKNPELFYNLWCEAILAQKDHKVIWTLGFRGQGDHPFWEDDPSYKTPASRGKLISSIIKKQYDLISQYVKNPVCCTNLYGEIMELYKDGFIKIPDGIIKIWADNGYGKTVSRRQWNDNPRVYALPQKGEGGSHGLYYHVTFHDLQASNHLTMLPNLPEFVREELKKAFSAGATDYLILNCGNIRMHTYMLDLVCELWRSGDVSVKSHLSGFEVNPKV